MVEVRDVGLRESVTPRAAAVANRITEAMANLARCPDAAERRQQLKEWQFVIDMTIAWGRDLTVAELVEWNERLGCGA